MDEGIEHDLNNFALRCRELVEIGDYETFAKCLMDIEFDVLARLSKTDDFLVAFLKFKLHIHEHDDVFDILKMAECRAASTRHELVRLWWETIYRRELTAKGRPHNAVNKFRTRERFPIPPGLRDGTSRHNRMLGPARQILREWFDAHDHRPFPSGTEKRYLARSSGLTLTQVKNWFVNARRRKRHKTNGSCSKQNVTPDVTTLPGMDENNNVTSTARAAQQDDVSSADLVLSDGVNLIRETVSFQGSNADQMNEVVSSTSYGYDELCHEPTGTAKPILPIYENKNKTFGYLRDSSKIEEGSVKSIIRNRIVFKMRNRHTELRTVDIKDKKPLFSNLILQKCNDTNNALDNPWYEAGDSYILNAVMRLRTSCDEPMDLSLHDQVPENVEIRPKHELDMSDPPENFTSLYSATGNRLQRPAIDLDFNHNHHSPLVKSELEDVTSSMSAETCFSADNYQAYHTSQCARDDVIKDTYDIDLDNLYHDNQDVTTSQYQQPTSYDTLYPYTQACCSDQNQTTFSSVEQTPAERSCLDVEQTNYRHEEQEAVNVLLTLQAARLQGYEHDTPCHHDNGCHSNQ